MIFERQAERNVNVFSPLHNIWVASIDFKPKEILRAYMCVCKHSSVFTLWTLSSDVLCRDDLSGLTLSTTSLLFQKSSLPLLSAESHLWLVSLIFFWAVFTISVADFDQFYATVTFANNERTEDRRGC